jgi:RNA polymerase sigma-32 factor
LITYAVWWIRAQIHAFILRSWSLVKIGAGNNGRKLFFNLRKESSRAEQQYFGDVDVDALAERLGVATSEWNAMAARMALRDFSLDCPIGDDDGTTHLERLCDDDVPSAETALVNRQEHKLLASAVAETRRTLNEKESVILDERLLADEPKTMAELGESLGISRQRVQQIEVKILDKLRQAWNAPAT